MNKHEMFELSLKKWGLQSQILMLVEELNELAVASLHLLRRLKDKEKALEQFAEEIADVEFMIEEMKYYFKNEQKVKLYRTYKEERLKQILKGLNFSRKNSKVLDSQT